MAAALAIAGSIWRAVCYPARTNPERKIYAPAMKIGESLTESGMTGSWPEVDSSRLESTATRHRLAAAPAVLAHEQKQVLSLNRFDFWPGCRGFKRVRLTRIGLAIEGES